jgi:hypothetical protein
LYVLLFPTYRTLDQVIITVLNWYICIWHL